MSSETGQPLKPDILKMMLPNFQPSTKRTLRCKTYHHSDMPATIFSYVWRKIPLQAFMLGSTRKDSKILSDFSILLVINSIADIKREADTSEAYSSFAYL